MNKQADSKRDSLRSFLRNQLLLLTGFIVAGFASLILYIYVDALDIATRKGLLVIGAYYAQLHDEGSLDKTILESDEFSIFVGQENLPISVSLRFPENVFNNYELYKNRINSDEKQPGVSPFIMLTAMPIEKGERQLFAVYHFHNNTAVNTRPPVLETVLIASFVVFFILLAAVFWMARRFNRRVLEPMEALADMAHKADETSPVQAHPILQDRTEIGLVAHALKQAMERIHTFHQREKTFLQNASHELRTPITVVGSALDIIERRLAMGKQDISQPLLHIRQACVNMKETTEALLWLSLEAPPGDRQADQPPGQSLEKSPIKADDLQQILTELVDQLGYLIEGRKINVSISMNTQNIPLYDPALVRILLANLIRNAFEHTFEGQIDIDVNNSGICITDTGIGLSGDTNLVKRGQSGRDSFGLGLDIVSRIANRKGWKLTLNSNANGGCSATLNWAIRP
ncbi:sensor histidine kinase [Neptunomonas antarctica]|uniref:histidine kinase n=1 Tax=Neptunomonas antarctica TaxID=619304 RepID=A0A1N7KZZ7_9GAMM|nr:HAMP domain-containing sensor histidine kinase [Neptunomonas antarctica]SIS67086.1 Signal transduction histidine kinase [Neptunomonas antarctica]